MDPTKQAGKIREQVEKEGAARRKFAQTLADLTKPELNKFYNQNFINEQIHKSTDMKGYYPYKYIGQGDSYFVSKDMYNSLVATCRCGRPKSDGHVIKCLQKVKNKYLEKLECTPAGRSGTYDNIGDYGSSDYSKKNGSASSSWKPFFIGKVPETSGGMVGWAPNRFAQWERSARYISPVLTMPGHRIAERPYNHIFIG